MSKAYLKSELMPDLLRIRLRFQSYLIAFIAVVAVAGLCMAASSIIDYRSVGMFFMFTISLLAFFYSRAPVLTAAVLSAIIWNYFFIPPQFTFHIYAFSDALMVSMYFIIAILIGTLTARLRIREMTDRLREQQAVALYTLVKEIIRAESADDIIRTAVKHIGDLFNARVVCFPADGHGGMSHTPHPAGTFMPAPDEWSVAAWTFKNRLSSGHGTNTFSFAEALYFPLLTVNDAVGVIGVRLEKELSKEQDGLLQTFIHQIAIALERELLRTAAGRAQVLMESERLYNTLLNSVSHELRTPLSTITGASSSLIDMQVPENPFWKLLVGDIYSSALRLNRLVKNLLDMSRLESGRLKLNVEWCDVTDLVDVVQRRLANDLSTHTLILNIQSELPLVRVDFGLMEQALSNILLNASQHTPAGTQITLGVMSEEHALFFIIEDDGPGFPSHAPDHIFEKFFRLPGAKSGGTGLGLSIARGFIEAHGGSIHAENREANGARFIIRIPAPDAPTISKETVV